LDEKKRKKRMEKQHRLGLTFSATDVDSTHHPFSHPVGYGWMDRWMYEKMIHCWLIREWHSFASQQVVCLP
jgi:hypothetical protein